MARTATNQIHLRVSDELFRKLEAYAESNNRSVPNSVIHLVTNALDEEIVVTGTVKHEYR